MIIVNIKEQKIFLQKMIFIFEVKFIANIIIVFNLKKYILFNYYHLNYNEC